MPLHSSLGDRARLHLKKMELIEIESRVVVTGAGQDWGTGRCSSEATKFQLGNVSFTDLLHSIVTAVNNQAFQNCENNRF